MLALFENATFVAKLYSSKSPRGDDFSVGLVNDQNGKRFPVLIDSREFPLDQVAHLKGLTVKVRPTEKGIRLRPYSQQSDSLVETLKERLKLSQSCLKNDSGMESKPTLSSQSKGDDSLSLMPALRSLITNVAESCQKHQLAAAAWIFFPAPTFEEDSND